MFIGQKVVCVGDGKMPPEHLKFLNYNKLEGFFKYTSIPKIGQTYVIEKLITYPAWEGKFLGVALVGGYTAFDSRLGVEVGYDSRIFEPLEYVQLKNQLREKIGA